jgi:hypothetical protein
VSQARRGFGGFGAATLVVFALLATAVALEGSSRARCARVERALEAACHYEGDFPTVRALARAESASLLARVYPLHARRLRLLERTIADYERQA